ncbi:calcium-binding protein [uncultured Caulobacter sp.]|uniref:calcium-binding protein n=1 Tax=uncultured Caulobacter sp. TaxID=158749 RepID=UPI002617B607|nr:calcium-binding protein [uncultured Caulobacter sp.]
MGEILAFNPKPLGGDWSPNERGLLALLTRQLAESYGAVDGVFGKTDSGDPWYVVTDANQDVLVHIARIDGQFVVHDAAVDMYHQVSSLWGALRQVLSSGAPQEAGSVVVAFNPSSREAQSFLSLVIAVGLYLELRGPDPGEAGRLNFETLPHVDDLVVEDLSSKLIAALSVEAGRVQGHVAGPTAAPVASPPAEAPQKTTSLQSAPQAPPPPPADALPVVHITPVAPAAAPAKLASEDARAPVQEPAPEGRYELPISGPAFASTGLASAKATISGTVGNDVLVGGPTGEVIAGGPGNDYIDGGGAGKGEVDRIDGGAGDDRIVMNARVVASGSAGADTFLVSAKPPATPADALLGVVLDYSAAKGDHLAVQGQGHLTVVNTANVADVLAAQGHALGEGSTAAAAGIGQIVSGARVGFDIDGDGREDVFILLGGAVAGTFKVGTTIANDHDPTPPVPLVGQPSADVGHVGETPPRF